jgi:hypothetical protein
MHPPLPRQQSASLLLAVEVSPSPPGRLACGLPASSALFDTQRSSTPCSGTGRSGATLAWRTRRWRTLAWNPTIVLADCTAVRSRQAMVVVERVRAVGGLREKESANVQGVWQMIDWRDE